MKIKDEKLLSLFRAKRQCQYCWTHTTVQPHHVFARGMGGIRRLDVAINLIALCPFCHRQFHDGHIQRHHLLEKIARREKRTVDDLLDELYLLLRK